MPPKTCSLKAPPGVRRTCNSRSAASCGGFASEKLRRRSPGNITSTYWPACQVNGSIAGSLSHSPMTSGASLCMRSTRAGNSRISTSVTWRISRVSMTRSCSARAWQMSA